MGSSKEYNSAYYKRNKEKIKKQEKARYDKNREVIRQSRKQYYQDNKSGFTNRFLVRQYGISDQDYAEMLLRQGGVCKICSLPEAVMRTNGKPHRLSVDHDHQTGKVRGLLCHHCNHAIGKMKDNPERLRKAALYLEGKLP